LRDGRELRTIAQRGRDHRAVPDALGAAPDGSSTFSTLPGAGQAALVLLGYTAVFIGLTLWRFRARDLTSS
jgi:hypothetical protein